MNIIRPDSYGIRLHRPILVEAFSKYWPELRKRHRIQIGSQSRREGRFLTKGQGAAISIKSQFLQANSKLLRGRLREGEEAINGETCPHMRGICLQQLINIEHNFMQFANSNLIRISHFLNDRKTAEEVVEQGQKAYKLQKNQLKLITTTFILEYLQKQQKYSIDQLLPKQESIGGEEENWSPNQLKIFTWVVLSYAHLQQKSLPEFDDRDISTLREFFPTKAVNFIKYHHLFLCKSSVRQSRCEWQQAEVELLTDIITYQPPLPRSNCFERKWADIAYVLYCRSALAYFKTSHQCREKWFNHLNPALSKEKWTIEEDVALFRNARDLGSKWAKISKAMGECRTEHMIKNRFKSIAKKYENRFQRCTVRKRVENILKDLELKSLTIKEKQNMEIEENEDASIKEDPTLDSELRGSEQLETAKEKEQEANIIPIDTDFNVTPLQQSPKLSFNKIHASAFQTAEFVYAEEKYDFIYDEGIIVNLRQGNAHSDIMLIDYLNIDFETRNKTIFSGSVE